MNLRLVRFIARKDGIFGRLLTEDGIEVASTLEHAYAVGNAFQAKVAKGTYTCIRHSPVRLNYETFMLENVPDFEGNPVSGILLHVGNFNHDSDGCILLGRRIVDNGSEQMITSSKNTFNKFMDIQKNVNQFILAVE